MKATPEQEAWCKGYDVARQRNETAVITLMDHYQARYDLAKRCRDNALANGNRVAADRYDTTMNTYAMVIGDMHELAAVIEQASVLESIVETI